MTASSSSRSYKLSVRELATVLAALRFWQRAVPERSAKAYSPEHFEDVQPLSHSEIDTVCDRLNVGK